jgi:hypothetical protein
LLLLLLRVVVDFVLEPLHHRVRDLKSILGNQFWQEIAPAQATDIEGTRTY